MIVKKVLTEDISWSLLKNKKPLLYKQWLDTGLTQEDFENYSEGSNGGKKFSGWDLIRNYISDHAKNVNNTEPNSEEDSTNSNTTKSDIIDYRYAKKELDLGKFDAMYTALKQAGHEQAAKVIEKFKLQTQRNFINSLGINELSSWKLPFLKMLDNPKAYETIYSDYIFTKAYNLLYTIKDLKIADILSKQNPASIVFSKGFFENIEDTHEAKALIQYVADHPLEYNSVLKAIVAGDYNKFISDDIESTRVENVMKEFKNASKEERLEIKNRIDKESNKQ